MAQIDQSQTFQTLGRDGAVPECRMSDALACQEWVKKMEDKDASRSKSRGKVFGLVAGFPPFSPSKLRDANRGNATNANFLTSNAYMEAGAGALYDLFSEAPGLVGIKTSHGSPEERDEWSSTMSAEADRIFLEDELFDYEVQCSGWQTTLNGCGPLIFWTPTEVIPHSVHAGDLKVPERTKADSAYYDACAVDVVWYPTDLYKYIRDEKTAQEAGWNVRYIKKMLSERLKTTTQRESDRNWEYFAQQLKNNSVAYEDDTLVIKVAFCWWKEFNGKITSAIVERNSNGDGEVEYIYQRVNQYDSFKSAVHPMYYDRGHGGFHHSVSGLGVKMYSAMDIENKMLCALHDKAKAPTTLFSPINADAKAEFEMAQFADYAVMPFGFEAKQNPLNGYINEGLAMYRTTSELMRSNLSSYRQPVKPDLPGNPATALQVSVEASQQSSLNKTTFTRYYRQLDALYTEMVRRLCLSASDDARAKKFQERCMAKGVPKECFKAIERVEAMRVIGQGSAFLRQQAMNAVMQIVGSLPEEGKQRAISSYIAANAGQAAALFFNPTQRTRTPSDQEAIAALQVAAMKQGMPPVITENQNPIIFAKAFLQACVDAVNSIEQGADIRDVVVFLDLAAPAAGAHIRRAMIDPLRKAEAIPLANTLEELSKVADDLKKQLADQAAEQQQLAGQMNQTIDEHKVKMFKAESDAAVKERKMEAAADLARKKAEHQMQLNQTRQAQQMAIADAQSASGIMRENAKQQADAARAERESRAAEATKES